MQFLIDRGNVTTYEWIHGEAPLSVEEPRLDFGDDDDGGGNDATHDAGVTDNVDIDFDFDLVSIS